MKKAFTAIIVAFILTVCAPYMLCTEVLAATDQADSYGIAPLSEEDAAAYASEITFSAIGTPPTTMPISCFDISDDGLIAVCFKTSATSYIICVYSEDFTFQYGFSFYSMGSAGVSWIQDELNVYFVRSGILVTVDENAKITKILGFPDTVQSDKYYRQEILVTSRTFDGKQYVLDNPGIQKLTNQDYARLSVKDGAGNTSVLYGDSTLPPAIVMVLVVAALIMVIAIALRIVLVLRKRAKAKAQ